MVAVLPAQAALLRLSSCPALRRLSFSATMARIPRTLRRGCSTSRMAITKGKDLFVQVNRSIKFPPKGKMDWVVKEFAENLEEKLEGAGAHLGNFRWSHRHPDGQSSHAG